jgi:hypothetical protein
MNVLRAFSAQFLPCEKRVSLTERFGGFLIDLDALSSKAVNLSLAAEARQKVDKVAVRRYSPFG